MTLNPDNTVLEEARTVRVDLSPEVIRGKLGAFLFSGDDVFKTVSDLSGGQQNRLMLCKLVLSEPDVLLLDEPTNHLDIPSREMLEAALVDYNGTVIAVSHDRYFLDRVMDRLLIIGADGQGKQQFGAVDTIGAARTDTDGIFSTYILKIQAQRAAAEKQKIAASRKNQKIGSANAPKNKTPDHLRPFNKYSIKQIEEMIHTQELTLEQMQRSFGDETVYQNHQRLT